MLAHDRRGHGPSSQPKSGMAKALASTDNQPPARVRSAWRAKAGSPAGPQTQRIAPPYAPEPTGHNERPLLDSTTQRNLDRMSRGC